MSTYRTMSAAPTGQSRRIMVYVPTSALVLEDRANAQHVFFMEEDETSHLLRVPWDDASRQLRLMAADGLLAIGTQSDEFVKVEVVALEMEPSRIELGWEHLVESSLELSSGVLLLKEPLPPEPRPIDLGLKAGKHRVRVGWTGLVSKDEHIVIRLWPDERPGLEVLQWYAPWKPREWREEEGSGRLGWKNMQAMAKVGERIVEGQLITTLHRDQLGDYWEYDWQAGLLRKTSASMASENYGVVAKHQGAFGRHDKT